MRVQRLVIIALMALMVASCLPGQKDSPKGLPPVGADLVAAARATCEKDGGTFGRGGIANTNVCLRTPRDAGKYCTQNSDCTSVCLARSRSCAPIDPLFGCNEVLIAPGSAATICID